MRDLGRRTGLKAQAGLRLARAGRSSARFRACFAVTILRNGISRFVLGARSEPALGRSYARFRAPAVLGPGPAVRKRGEGIERAFGYPHNLGRPPCLEPDGPEVGGGRCQAKGLVDRSSWFSTHKREGSRSFSISRPWLNRPAS